MKRDPYNIIKKRIISEKASMLEGLKDSEKNKTIKKFKKAKYVFKVDIKANKQEIKKAIENIYSVKVDYVNTLIMKPREKIFRGKKGKTKAWKKAIITLKEGETIKEGK